MQKKNNENFLEKIVKKDYNNELEKVLENKMFKENVKSNLLSILYKIEAGYDDYAIVKQNVETKEEFIKMFIKNIEENCEDISFVQLHTKQSELMNNRTFLIDKKNKRIICYPIERKMLYAISKISKNDIIIKNKYFIINKTLSNLINVGNCINSVEPLRDFNGYSWISLPREIESIDHNLVYQNLRFLIGYEFLNNWVENKDYIIDYMESFENKLEEYYGKKIKNKIIECLKKISILLEIRFNKNSKYDLNKLKQTIEEQIIKMQDNKSWVENITKKKRELTKDIKLIDETLNNKEMLQKEYIKRNEKLEISEKIFSIRVLSEMMSKERNKKIKEIEKLNEILNPQKFIKLKKELEERKKLLEIIETKDLQKDLEMLKLILQKLILKCYQVKIEKAETKQQILKLIYEFRYYNLLPFSQEKRIIDKTELKKQLNETGEMLIQKATKIKLIDIYAKDEKLNYEIAKNIFNTRIINLEQMYIQVTKENESFFVQIFDEKSCEEKNIIKADKELNKKNLQIKLNKKIKVFSK